MQCNPPNSLLAEISSAGRFEKIPQLCFDERKKDFFLLVVPKINRSTFRRRSALGGLLAPGDRSTTRPPPHTAEPQTCLRTHIGNRCLRRPPAFERQTARALAVLIARALAMLLPCHAQFSELVRRAPLPFPTTFTSTARSALPSAGPSSRKPLNSTPRPPRQGLRASSRGPSRNAPPPRTVEPAPRMLHRAPLPFSRRSRQTLLRPRHCLVAGPRAGAHRRRPPLC